MDMFQVMTNGNPPTTLAAIEDFERDRDLALPDSYRNFLLTTNGGVPDTPAFPVEGIPGTRIWVMQAFFGIGVPEPTNELAYGYASDASNDELQELWSQCGSQWGYSPIRTFFQRVRDKIAARSST